MNINKLSGSKVQFEVIIPVETFNKCVDQALVKKLEEVEMPGFRKGKAPKDVYLAKYGIESVYSDALQDAISETYFAAISENKIDVCGYPHIDLDQAKVNQKDPIHYFVTVSVYPTVELGEYTNIEIKKEKVSVSAKEVEEHINQLLERESMLVKKGDDSTLGKGDTAIFDFEGFKDGVAFEGGSAKDYQLEIGSNQFIPGFEDQMVGMKANEERDLNVKFPEDYHAEDLKGADAVFHVTLKDIKINEKPELNDQFVKEQKIEGVETVADYKKYVKKELTEHKEEHATEHATNDLFTKVIENAKFELPEDLVEEEANYSYQNAEAQAKQYGMPLETLLMYSGGGSVEEFKARLHEQAHNTLSLRFVLKEISKKENIKATKKEIEDKYNEIAEQYKITVEQVQAQMPESAVSEEIQVNKAYQFVIDNNKFVVPSAKKAEETVEEK